LLGETLVFSNELGRARYDLGASAGPILVATVLLVAVVGSLVSARTIPFLFAGYVAAHVTMAVGRGSLPAIRLKPNELHWSFGLLLLWSLVTLSWSADAAHGLLKVLIAMALLLASTVVAALVTGEARTNLLRMAEGLWLGLAIGLGYFLIETLSDQSIKIWIYNSLGLRPGDLKPPGFFTWENGKLVSILAKDLTRNTAPIPLLVWAGMLAVRGSQPAFGWRVIGIGLGALAMAAVAVSQHETSKIAMVIGVVVWTLATLSPRWTPRLIGAGWLSCTLAIVPASLLLHRLDLHNAAWVPPTAQHRIIIWNHTAEQTLARPILGVGAHATYRLGPETAQRTVNAPDEHYQRTLSRHAHNVYLQTWFELGAVGAMLLALVGLAMLRILARQREALRPLGYATFACGTVIAGASYGMWQIWYMALFAFAITMFVVAARAFETRPSLETST
jgi:O-antigen ligase